MSEKKSDATATALPNRRRQFLGQIGLMGAGAVLASCGPAIAQPTPAKRNVDAAILNFALNLEYLEAAFYAAAVGRIADYRAIAGAGAEVIFPDGFDPTKGIDFTATIAPELNGQVVREYAQEVAEDELNHVKFLRSALGKDAVPPPKLDLANSFITAGRVASDGAITNFNPYANPLFFLHGAFIFEDVGVNAYKAAAPLVTSDEFLAAAAGILAVEAYHAGEIRASLYGVRNFNVTPDLTVAQVVQAISNARDTLGGNTEQDQGIVAGLPGNPEFIPAGANIVMADANGIAIGRTPKTVLNIVYLDLMGKLTPGGFFPNGINTGRFGEDFKFLLSL